MRPLTDLVKDFATARRGMEKLVKDAPRIIGNEAVRVVKMNFSLSGYDSGNGFTKWVQRKTSTNQAYTRGRSKGGRSQYKGSVFSASNPILIQTRNLYNAIQYKTRAKSVFIGVNTTLIPYAKVHNEGGRNTPRRQYMPIGGGNKKITRVAGEKLIFERDRIMKGFK
jgi:phage gpG-like protein